MMLDQWKDIFARRDSRRAELAQWPYGFTLDTTTDTLDDFTAWCDANLTEFEYIALGDVSMVGMRSETEALNFKLRWPVARLTGS